MSILRRLLLVALLVSQVLLGGGLLITCVERGGGRSTELALSVCCRGPVHAAGLDAPAASLADADDCFACVDERLEEPARREGGDPSPPLTTPSSAPAGGVDLEALRVARVELTSTPPDTPRRLRPAFLRC